MNYSLIILASDVPRFLVIHTAKPHSREGRHSREGGSSYAHWNIQKGRPVQKAIVFPSSFRVGIVARHIPLDLFALRF